MKLDIEEEFLLEDEFFAEGETSEPPSTELVKIEETFAGILGDPQAIRDLVREKYVPAALLAYEQLLTSADPKIRKAAADTIMEIADVKDNNKSSGGGSGVINFNLGLEAQGILTKALGTLAHGKIMQIAEVVEDE